MCCLIRGFAFQFDISCVLTCRHNESLFGNPSVSSFFFMHCFPPRSFGYLCLWMFLSLPYLANYQMKKLPTQYDIAISAGVCGSLIMGPPPPQLPQNREWWCVCHFLLPNTVTFSGRRIFFMFRWCEHVHVSWFGHSSTSCCSNNTTTTSIE